MFLPITNIQNHIPGGGRGNGHRMVGNGGKEISLLNLQLHIKMGKKLNIFIICKSTPQPIGPPYRKIKVMYKIYHCTKYAYVNYYPP